MSLTLSVGNSKKYAWVQSMPGTLKNCPLGLFQMLLLLELRLMLLLLLLLLYAFYHVLTFAPAL